MDSATTAMAPEFWEKFGVTARGIPRKGAVAGLRADLQSEVQQSEVQRRGIQDQSVAINPKAEMVEIERYLDQATGQVSCARKGSPGTEKLVPYSPEAEVTAGLIGEDPAGGPERSVEVQYEGGQLIDLNEKPARDATVASPSRSRPIQPDAQYLEDLRDDFALHSPLWMKEGESMDEFAARRWAYAASMMKARPASAA